MTTAINTATTGERELTEDELNHVSGGIIAVLIGLSSGHDIVTATTPPNGHVK